MGQALSGKRIAIAGSRKTEEMSVLIEKHGGVPVARPLQGVTFLDIEEVEKDLRMFADLQFDWAVFTTGIGTEALLDAADQIGIGESFAAALQRVNIAVRGYKTLSVLKKRGIEPVAVDDDGTTQGLIRVLDGRDFAGTSVFIQLHGEPVPELVRFFEERNAAVKPLLPYRHVPPETSVLETLCREITEGGVHAICFTTGVQVRYLFQYATEIGVADRIRGAFSNNVLAVAVGKVTAEQLRAEQIVRILSPGTERMGAMVVELARYFEQTGR